MSLNDKCIIINYTVRLRNLIMIYNIIVNISEKLKKNVSCSE